MARAFQTFLQFGNPQISPYKFLSCSPCWSKKQDAGKDTSNAKRIFSDNVTCFGKNKSCSKRSHLQECFLKAFRFLLAWLLCFYRETTKLRVLATKGAGPSCTSLGLPFTSSGIECNLVLRMASRSSYNRSQQFYPFLFQDLFQDLFQSQALGNANHEHICSIMQ